MSKGSAEALFNVITGMVEWHGDTILIADAGNHAIYKYSTEAGTLSSFARVGDGPGEVRTPYFLATTPEGGVATFSVERQSVEFFDANGKFLERIHLQGGTLSNPKGLAILSDGTLVISGGILGNSLGVHQYSREGRSLRSWIPNPETTNPAASIYMAGGAVTALEGGGFLYSNASPHTIIEFDPTYREAVIAADSGILVNPGDDFIVEREIEGRPVHIMRWWYPQSRAILRLRDESTLNVITRFYDRLSQWERWSRDGDLIERFNVPVAYHPFSLTSRGTVLASYRDPDTDEHIAVELRVVSDQVGNK